MYVIFKCESYTLALYIFKFYVYSCCILLLGIGATEIGANQFYVKMTNHGT